MKHVLVKILVAAVVLFGFAGLASADALSKADAAVANILFDFDGSDQFATYRVNEDGFVDIVFASNMPDRIYSALLARLEGHPDIKGVLAGKSGPSCTVDGWKEEGASNIKIPEF